MFSKGISKGKFLTEPTKEELKPKVEEKEPEELLDSLDQRAELLRKGEKHWKKMPNLILEKHPYFCGYAFLTSVVILVFATHLTAFLVSFLFLYLISDFLTNDVRRYIPFLPKALLFSILYVVVISFFTVLLYNVIPNFIKQLPSLANQLQAQAIDQFEYANQRWNLTQYVDPQEVRSAIVKGTTRTLSFFVGSLSAFYKGFIYFIFALVINLLLYHNTEKIDNVFIRKRTSLMVFFYRFTKVRLSIFYFYFKRVMGGQIIISAINTVISSVIIILLGLPHPVLLISVVFFFGLFPVVGNIASNTVVTLTAFLSNGMLAAAICLGLMIGIHKLEYFLNSRIIGEIVHLPMVITLTALVVCEVLLGIIGLMLAIPLVLYTRHELEHVPGLNSDSSLKKKLFSSKTEKSAAQ